MCLDVFLWPGSACSMDQNSSAPKHHTIGAGRCSNTEFLNLKRCQLESLHETYETIILRRTSEVML